MKKYVILILSVLLLFNGCTKDIENTGVSPTENGELINDTEIAEETATPELTSEPTPEPTPEPAKFDVDSVSDKSLNGLLRDYDIPEDTTQLIMVAAGQTYNKMYLMEKYENGMWQVVHGPFDVRLGKNGLGKEKEGDGKSPEGIYELGYAFGRDFAPVGTTWPWRTTEAGDIWVEDPSSKYYNMFVQQSAVDDKDWKYFSNLDIAAFSRAIEIRYNSERESGAGSAIFLHIWISPNKDTNGCTSISKENIETLIAWLDPSANTMIAQLPYDVIGYGDLVYLSDYSCDIAADIKFASDDNIFGTKLEGYNDNQIITKVSVAEALTKANDILKKYDVKLVVYDAYRPVAAFYQIENWLKDTEDTSTQEEYYKDFTKAQLKEEYFVYNSNKLYTRAQVVHVSLADLYNNPLDMGGEYMVFDEFTSYVCDDLTYEQIYNRELLHDIMIQAGFTSVENQWWKFEYNPYLYVTKYDEIIE